MAWRHPRLRHPMHRPTAAALAAAAALILAGCTHGFPDLPTVPGTVASSVTGPAGTPPASSAGPTSTRSGNAGSGSPSGSAGSGAAGRDGSSTGTTEQLPVLEDVHPPEWQPRTRTDELALQLSEATPGDDGTLPTQLAIDIFSVTLGPIPGSTPSDLPAGDGLSRDTALYLIDTVRDSLAPEQQAAVDAARPEIAWHTTIGADGTVTTPMTPGPGRSVGAPIPPARERHVAQLAGQVHLDWNAHNKDVANSATSLNFASSQQDPKVLMDAGPLESDPDMCEITIYPLAWDAARTDQEIKTTVAHELYHCAEFRWLRGGAPPPDWVMEGAADWAAFDLYRAQAGPPERLLFDEWFSAPHKPLAARSYDAWPLYESVRDFGLDPYRAMKELVQAGPAGSTHAQLQSAGLERLDFQTFVSSQSLRTTRLPDPSWMVTWPAPDASAGPRDTEVTEDTKGIGTYAIHGDPRFGHQQIEVPMTSEVGLVAVVGVNGPIQTIADDGTQTIGEGHQHIFCVDSHRCPCPPGRASIVSFHYLTPPMMFSFPQRAVGTVAAVKGVRWDPDKYCGKAKPSRFGGMANGDPHLLTFDGLPYDFMAPGEFVLLRTETAGTETSGDGTSGDGTSGDGTSGDGAADIEVQIRNEPLPLWGAGTSAVAIGTGGHRITLTADGLTKQATSTVRVDGEQTTDTEILIGTATARLDGSDATITWPDGTEIDLRFAQGYFVSLTLPEARGGHVQGLLGNANGTLIDDLLLPDGSRAALYPDDEFADGWAVDDAGTLFDYLPGQSPATFRAAVPPPPPQPTDEVVTRCTQALGEHAAGYEIDSCTYDLTVTGNTDFVDVYSDLTEQRVTEQPAVLSAQTPPDTTGNGTDPGAASTDQPALTLAGSISLLGDYGNDVDSALEGSLTLAAATVVVARVDLCRPDVDVTVHLSSRAEDGLGADALPCDPNGFGTYDALDGDLVTGNEAYLLVPAAGDYDVSVTTGSTDPVALTVQLFADPTPTVLGVDQVAAAGGWQGTLSGIADTVILQTNTGHDIVDWTRDADDGVCAALAYGPQLTDDGPWALGGVCHQQQAFSESPTLDTDLPMVIFARTGGPHPVTLHG